MKTTVSQKMASFEEHCADCIRELGEPFEQVHRWLDALFATLGPQHRSVRHNSEGIETVRKMWGDRAAQAAEIHIRKDFGKFIESGGLWIPDER